MQNYKKDMENIGDWLYLIFIAIAVIAGMIKPRKKQDASAPPPVAHDRDPWESSASQQPAKQQSANTQQKPLTWQEILQTLTEETKKTQTQPQKTTLQTQRVNTQKQTSSTKKPAAKPFLSGESASKKQPVTSSIAAKIKHFADAESRYNTEETSIQLNFDDPEEIKKGIIYAEIFNKRY